jgi:hypothetical protein
MSNAGARTFTSSSAGVSASAQFVAVGDLNGDGAPDLVSTGGASVVVMMRNAANTGWDAPTSAGAANGSARVPVAIGDLNGDGKRDIAFANSGASSVFVIMRNAANTGWDAPDTAGTTGVGPYSVAIGDLNGDHQPDLAMADTGSAQVTVIMRNGAGTGWDAAATAGSTGTYPYQVAIGDLDGDGKADLATSNLVGSVTVITRNTDNTGWSAPSSAGATGNGAQSIALGDLNGDGRIDIATANSTPKTVTVITRNSNNAGWDAPDTAGATGDEPSGLSIGDLTGDGKPDLAVTNYTPATLTLIARKTDGTGWAAPTTAGAAGIGASGVVIADLNSDGKLDVAVATRSSRVTVLMADVPVTTDNVPAGYRSSVPVTLSATAPGASVVDKTYYTTGPAPATPTTSSAVYNSAAKPTLNHGEKISYFSVDTSGTAEAVKTSNAAKVDATTPVVSEDVPATYRTSSIVVTLTATDAGGSGVDKTYYTTGTTPATPTVTSSVYSAGSKPQLANGEKISYFTVDGAGNTSAVKTSRAAIIAPATNYYAPSTAGDAGGSQHSIAVGDLNGDGKPDLVTANGNDPSVTVFTRNAAGTGWDTPATISIAITGTFPYAVAIGDLNGDGKPDLATANAGNNSVTVITRDAAGTGWDAPATAGATGGFPRSVAIGDLNGDGKNDLATANSTSDSVSVITRNTAGTGWNTRVIAGATGSGPRSVAIGDLNGDGDNDLATANYSANTVTVITHKAADSAWATASTTTLTTGGGPASVAIGDLNGDAKPDLATANTLGNSVTVITGNALVAGGWNASATTSTQAAGGSPYSVAIGDLSGDGLPDLATANYGIRSATVITRNPLASGWDTPTPVAGATGTPASAVAIGDLNGDGRLDLALAKGNVSSVAVLTALYDNVAPTTADSVDAAWHAAPVDVTLTATDTGGSDTAATHYTKGAIPATPTTASAIYNPAAKPTLADGEKISYFSVDKAGNAEAVKTSSSAAKVDATPPTTVDDVDANWHPAAVTVTLTGTDEQSDVAETYFTVGATPATPTTSSSKYSAGKPTLANGEKVSYFSVNGAGTASAVTTSGPAKVDTTPPTTDDDVDTDWHPAAVTVTLTAADDESGAPHTYFTVGTTPTVPTTSSDEYNGNAKPTLADGQKIRYFSVNGAGTAGPIKTSDAAKVDNEKPSTTDSVDDAWHPEAVEVTLTPTDTGGSGVAKTYFTTGAAPATPTTASAVYGEAPAPTLANGEKISYFTLDGAGNSTGVQTSAKAAKVDTSAPSTADDVDTDWHPAPVTVTLTRTDDESDVVETYFTTGTTPAVPTTSSSKYSAGKPSLANGEKVRYFSVNGAGTAGPIETSKAAKVDEEIPETTDSVDTAWHSGPVVVTLTATDDGGSDVAETYFTTGASPATPDAHSDQYDPTDKPTLADGEKISYFSVDGAGNPEAVKTSKAAKVDAGEPDTEITTAPASPGSATRPQIAFTSTATEASFECSLDDSAFAECETPFQPATALGDGEHTFAVRAVSHAGLPDLTPATAAFLIDTSVPVKPVVTGGPPASSTATTASVTFAQEPGSSATCQLDDAPPAACSSPYTVAGLPVGEHVVKVMQTDAAGNVSEPLVVSFSVTAPVVVPDPGPAPKPAAEPTKIALSLGFPILASGNTQLGLYNGSASLGCQAVSGTVATCSAQAMSLVSLKPKSGKRQPIGTLLATGDSTKGVADSSSLGVRLTLTAAGRKAVALHPLGIRVRLVLKARSTSGQEFTTVARVRLVANSPMILAIPGRAPGLSGGARSQLSRLVRVLPAVKTVECIADTDNAGSAAADLALTRKQAKAACDFLASKGLKAKLSSKGNGHAQPRASNNTKSGRALNRRLTIVTTI